VLHLIDDFSVAISSNATEITTSSLVYWYLWSFCEFFKFSNSWI